MPYGRSGMIESPWRGVGEGLGGIFGSLVSKRRQQNEKFKVETFKGLDDARKAEETSRDSTEVTKLAMGLAPDWRSEYERSRGITLPALDQGSSPMGMPFPQGPSSQPTQNIVGMPFPPLPQPRQSPLTGSPSTHDITVTGKMPPPTPGPFTENPARPAFRPVPPQAAVNMPQSAMMTQRPGVPFPSNPSEQALAFANARRLGRTDIPPNMGGTAQEIQDVDRRAKIELGMRQLAAVRDLPENQMEAGSTLAGVAPGRIQVAKTPLPVDGMFRMYNINPIEAVTVNELYMSGKTEEANKRIQRWAPRPQDPMRLQPNDLYTLYMMYGDQLTPKMIREYQATGGPGLNWTAKPNLTKSTKDKVTPAEFTFAAKIAGMVQRVDPKTGQIQQGTSDIPAIIEILRDPSSVVDHAGLFGPVVKVLGQEEKMKEYKTQFDFLQVKLQGARATKKKDVIKLVEKEIELMYTQMIQDTGAGNLPGAAELVRQAAEIPYDNIPERLLSPRQRSLRNKALAEQKPKTQQSATEAAIAPPKR